MRRSSSGQFEKAKPLEVRFWEKVVKGECWEWQGATVWFGYGVFAFSSQRKTVKAHRVAWELTFGPIPKDQCVLHHCDNPSCVRPDHLFLGSRADNNKDMKEKGRYRNGSFPGMNKGRDLIPPSTRARGERSGRAKLSEEAVRNLIVDATKGVPQRSIAKKYGVCRNTVQNIIYQKTWRHIPRTSDSTPPCNDGIDSNSTRFQI